MGGSKRAYWTADTVSTSKKADGSQDYWTLELGEDLCEEEGVLCAWNDEKQHRNYGLFIRPDPFVFLAAIRNKLDQSESDHEMLLSLHDYVEA